MSSVKFLLLISIIFEVSIRGESSVPLPQGIQEVDLSSYLEEIINNIREDKAEESDPLILSNGISEKFKQKNVDVWVQVDPGFTIRGISSAELKDFKVILHADRLGIEALVDLTCPSITAEGQYKMDGKVAKYVPLRGSGKIGLFLGSLTAKVSASTYFDGSKIKLKDLKISASTKSIKLTMDNLINEKLSPFLNSVINVLAQPMVNKFVLNNDDVMGKIHDLLRRQIDKQLDGVSDQIMDQIKGITG